MAAALLVALSSACSIIGVTRLEPDHPAGAQPDCTSSWTLPLVDGGMAITTGTAAVVLHGAASSRASEGKSSSGFRAAAWTVNALSVGFIASLAYGAYQRSRCHAAEIDAENAAPPAFLEESRPPRGGIGAACNDDGDCADDLLCGEPMKTCIPANPPQEPSSP
jgi:hypothetical protein